MISEEILQRINILDDALFETSRDMFADGAKRQPALICVFHKNPKFKRVILPADDFMVSNISKNALSSFIRMLVKRPEVDIVVLISEAWFVTQTNEQLVAEGAIRSPKDAVDRKECVVVAYTLKEGGATSTHVIERVNGKVILKRGDLNMKVAGRFIPTAESEDAFIDSIKQR